MSSVILVRSLAVQSIRRLHISCRFNVHAGQIKKPIFKLRKFATSTPIPDTPTNKDIDANNVKIHELRQVAEAPLLRIHDFLKSKNATYPLNLVNDEPEDFKRKLILRLRNNIYEQFSKFTYEKSTMTPISEIKLVDFVDPKMAHISQLIYLINAGKYPKNFLEFNQLESKQDLLLQIFTQLLYKEYYAAKIESTPSQSKEIDFSNPAEWYPLTRKMKRKVIMHVGPTNSGKTHNSLLKLSQVKTGYYAGPLRLLAREIFERFNREGIPCNLITGEEVVPKYDKFGILSGIYSGTVEMIPLHKHFELCIIDEIQMIGNKQRGCSWTNAFLGVMADEIHLCGEETAIPAIEKLVKKTGDELHVRRFERLGKLTIEDKPTDFASLRKGDCVIAFSKTKIWEYQCKIERTTNFKVAVVYGQLPPEIRAHQAELFNNGDYDILVASDAVGMGLNLKIRRVVFTQLDKFDGRVLLPLTISEVRQIGGRAGRFSREEGAQEGFITSLNKRNLQQLGSYFKSTPPPIKKVGIYPPEHIWNYYMSKTNSTRSFLKTVQSLKAEVNQGKYEDIFFCDSYDLLESLNCVPASIPISDQIRLAQVPVNARDRPLVQECLKEFFSAIANNETKNIFQFSYLDMDTLSSDDLGTGHLDEALSIVLSLEFMHKMTTVLMWLEIRYPTIFIDRQSIIEVKDLCEKRIIEQLDSLRAWNRNQTKIRRAEDSTA